VCAAANGLGTSLSSESPAMIHSTREAGIVERCIHRYDTMR
jgi:hypothetical protein